MGCFEPVEVCGLERAFYHIWQKGASFNMVWFRLRWQKIMESARESHENSRRVRSLQRDLIYDREGVVIAGIIKDRMKVRPRSEWHQETSADSSIDQGCLEIGEVGSVGVIFDQIGAISSEYRLVMVIEHG